MAYPYFITPTTTDVVYGPSPHHRFDHFKNATRDSGGNPFIVVLHGGAWTGKDKRLVSVITDELGVFTNAVLSKTGANDTHFDIISIETRQEVWVTSLSGAGYSYNEPLTTAAYYPETFEDVKRAIVAIKLMASTLGINPDKGAFCGSSAGAVMGMWSQLTTPRVASRFGGTPETASTRYPEGKSGGASVAPGSGDVNSVDSCLKAVYLIEPVFDFRQRGGVEVVAPGQWRAMIGYKVNSTTGAFYGTVPTRLRDAVSTAAYIESGSKRGWVPTMVSYATDIFGGSGDWTQGTVTLTSTGAFTDYSFQATDSVRMFKSGYPPKTLPIASRVSNDAITTTGEFHSTDLTGVTFEVLYGLPYGTLSRDPHNDQDIAYWIEQAQKKGLPMTGQKYSTYNDSTAQSAYGFLKAVVGK